MNNDTENCNYYNRIHYGTAELDNSCPECSRALENCTCEDDDEDDLLISGSF